MAEPDDVVFLASVADLREWVRDHAADADGVWLGFHRIRYGTDPGGTLRVHPAAEELAAAGWVEAGRRDVDGLRYAVRFAPGTVKARKAAPAWRDEPGEPAFGREYEERFRAHADAWAFFGKQAPRYRRAATWWVTSGKVEETRERRLEALIEACAAGERLPQLVRQL